MQSIVMLRPRGEMSTAWWAAATAMAVITVTTVTGNAAVMTALRRVRRVPTHYPMMSLAAADLLVGLFVLPIAAARELFSFHLNWAICSCWSTLDVLSCTASILSLCVLGWERWSGITAPFARAKRTKRAKIFAALVWPIATTVAVPTALIPSPKHYVAGEIAKACTVNTNIGYVFFSSSFSFYIPASIMIILYAQILRALASTPQIRCHRGSSPRGSKKKEEKPQTKVESKLKSDAPVTEEIAKSPKKVRINLSPKGCHLMLPNASNPRNCPSSAAAISSTSLIGSITRQRRATITIVMLMSLFLFCWTPFFVMLAADSICECVRDGTWQLCTWLGYTNSALNPIVYAASSPSIGKALQASLTSTSSTKNELQMSPVARKA